MLVAQARLAGVNLASAEASVPNVTLETLDVSFDAISDAKERACRAARPTMSTDCARSPAGC